MQEEKEVETINNRQVADSGGKIIFENPTLCSQLLSRYSGLEFLKGIKPEDIEDVTERFIPMFTEQRDADVVKKVHLSDEDTFKTRVALDNVFGEYIPNFKYHLISPGAFGREELIKRNDGMSFVMLINRIRNDKEFRELKIPTEYMNKLLEGSSKDVLIVIARVIAVILRKHNIPENDIQNLVDQLKERKSMALFDNYVASFDAQEERRVGADEMLIKLICGKLKKGISPEVISDQLSESGSNLAHLIEVASRHAPDYNIEDVMRDLSCVVSD